MRIHTQVVFSRTISRGRLFRQLLIIVQSPGCGICKVKPPDSVFLLLKTPTDRNVLSYEAIIALKKLFQILKRRHSLLPLTFYDYFPFKPFTLIFTLFPNTFLINLIEECKKSLETFQNEKSPGEDGFTVEFYKCFFELLGTDLVASLNAAYELGELSISQRRGVITLLPKEDGPLSALSNWRPITLLNTDYKIASKAIAKRLETVLSSLVHTDQTGFIKGRYIGENIRLINDVMEHTRIEKKGGILISLDFNKAFNSLEWPLITKVLNTFNF